MADDEQFSLCWNNFQSNLSAGFHESLCRGDLVDVTLAAEGQFVKAHRLVLSVCSPYFRKMFTQMPANQHAFVFLKDVSHTALKDLIQFMYCGEVNVKQEALPAFISTAEALQIKGLTDSDPSNTQSPEEQAPPTPQQISPPRIRQRASNTRSYKIETVDDSGDDKPTTQIVIQTQAAPSAQSTISQQSIQHHPTQQIAATVSAPTATVVSHKRPAQRSLGSTQAPHIKRTKSTTTTIDPLDSTETIASTATTTTTTQQITIQAPIVSDAKDAHETETEYIDLPIELPTKAEPDYAEESADVESADNDGAYVEDDSYGDLRYDESYFENDDANATANAAATSVSGAAAASSSTTASTSKVVVKQQNASYSDSSYVDGGDQSNNDAQGEVKFIRSQKKNAQLVYNGYIYNKKLTQANGHTTWRCIEVLKSRCKAVVITRKNDFIVARRQHNHENHLKRIGSRALYHVEEDLGEYIELRPEDPKLAEYMAAPDITLCTQKNGKEIKLLVPGQRFTTISTKMEIVPSDDT